MLLLLTHPKLGYALMQVVDDNRVKLYRYRNENSNCWSYYKESLQNLSYLDNGIIDLRSWTPASKFTRTYCDCSSVEEFLQNHPELLI